MSPAALLSLFIALAGWQAVMESLGWLFQLPRWLAAVYLIWFGWTLWRSRPAARSTPAVTGSLHTSLLAGLMLTLGDIKALVFYASFFPLFISAPLSPLLSAGTGYHCSRAVLVKGLYAVLGSRLSRPLNQPAARKTRGRFDGWLRPVASRH
ncbi:LysE family transporter [Halopseudomonas pachastrellae]|nr:LysE family transporter [Halopseudomonas pachastrellae]